MNGVAEPAPAIDIAGLREVTGGNAAVEQNLLADFRTSMREDETALRAAIAAGDTLAVRRYADRIQGACCVVAARELADTCGLLEAAATNAPQKTAGLDTTAFDRALLRVYDCVERMLAGGAGTS